MLKLNHTIYRKSERSQIYISGTATSLGNRPSIFQGADVTAEMARSGPSIQPGKKKRKKSEEDRKKRFFSLHFQEDKQINSFHFGPPKQNSDEERTKISQCR